MLIEIKVPEAGESITQVELAKWLVQDGDYVEKDQEIAEIDSDKATLTINADGSGTIQILVPEGTTVEPRSIIGKIDTSAAVQPTPTSDNTPSDAETTESTTSEIKPVENAPIQPPLTAPATDTDLVFTPQALRSLEENQIDPQSLIPNMEGRRITKKEVLWALAQRGQSPVAASSEASDVQQWGGQRTSETQKMSTLRKKIAERLVAVKNETAMLTTFNEVDMSAIMKLRSRYKDAFQKKYGVKPGLMSFFAKAVTQSIPFFPQVNAYIENGNIIIPQYADIGIAVSTPKGLMVPVIRNAETKSLAELELAITELAEKARNNKISIEELSGGTFSITNGGVFGSMLSTPILNPPQSAILGMHNIVERPVVVDGAITIRPIMYVALSYDHRIIDGRESVGFIVKVKELLENPIQLLYQGQDPEAALLGL